MKRFFKELFCNHIWKQVREEELGRYKKPGILFYNLYRRIAITSVCIKCKKEKIREYHYLMI